MYWNWRTQGEDRVQDFAIWLKAKTGLGVDLSEEKFEL
jgi:hypothetical protein